jgi:hypothetical protein
MNPINIDIDFSELNIITSQEIFNKYGPPLELYSQLKEKIDVHVDKFDNVIHDMVGNILSEQDRNNYDYGPALELYSRLKEKYGPELELYSQLKEKIESNKTKPVKFDEFDNVIHHMLHVLMSQHNTFNYTQLNRATGILRHTWNVATKLVLDQQEHVYIVYAKQNEVRDQKVKDVFVRLDCDAFKINVGNKNVKLYEIVINEKIYEEYLNWWCQFDVEC